MRTTARILAGLLFAGLGLLAARSNAGEERLAPSSALPPAVLGQAGPRDKMSQADDLLRRARQAMAEEDYDAADQLISRAEALDVSYGPMNLSDSPARARRELESRRRGDTARPGALFALPFRRRDDVRDPFAERDARRGSIAKLPPVDQVSPVRPPAGGSPRGADRIKSDEMLIGARRALALGDVRRAQSLVDQARATGVRYGMHEDSPAKIEAAIQQYESLMDQPTERRDTEGYRRQYARLLMDQAEALMQWNQYGEAERLALEAGRQRITWGPLDAKPETLLRQIDAARSESRGATELAHDSSGASEPSMAAKQKAARMLHYAREALSAGDLVRAENLARQAERMQVPESAFGTGEDSPGMLLAEIRQARLGDRSVRHAGGEFPVTRAAGPYDVGHRASHAVYDPRRDSTRNVPAEANAPYPGAYSLAQNREAPRGGAGGAAALFRQGEEALKNRDTEAALRYFRQAAQYRDELDPQSAQRLQEYLQIYSTPSSPHSMLGETLARQEALLRQVHADVAHQESTALRMRESDPKGALALLEETRKRVESSALDEALRNQLLRRIDRNVELTRKYISEHQPRIELDERNRRIQEEVDRNRMTKLEVQEKLALMVDDFNRLMDEQRYAEAELTAKKASALDPENPVVVQLVRQSQFIRRYMNNVAVADARERSNFEMWGDVDRASVVPVNDLNPLVFPDAREWERLTQSRARLLAEGRRGRSERDLEIEQKLKTPVALQFQNAPLATVMDYLAKLADVNLHLDPQGLAEEGVSTDTPVTINLSREISLRSALNLILQPLHLNYVIKDEVLKITSEQMRDTQVYPVSYPVADLVVPIPNFTPNPRMGLAGAYHDALGAIGFGGFNSFGGGSAPLSVVASRDGSQNSAMISPAVMAQMQQMTGGAAMSGPRSMPMGFGPGGLGGGAQADFDSLIDLITSTIKPTTWDDVGGPGSIAPFETNLSIVVSQTQDVHEEIVDLLEQLRRLQDLQVTIEVRFITLQDNFFERIGVDFDFDINDNIDRPFQVFGAPFDPPDIDRNDPDVMSAPPVRDLRDRDHDNSVVVGTQTAGANVNLGAFSADLDIPFRQDSFSLAVPQFGGFNAANNPGAQIGFAILSEIEAFFFIQAAQGDTRTNVLQAPKVTLFNGQQAFVSDTSQSPFVISVIPVVGDFAAAQQPVIVVLNEGTFLTVQAVVSNDRRFVRLTVVPFFSRIDEVNTFQFTGSETTSEETSTQGNQENPNDNTRNDESRTVTTSGTTVQLPTFSFVTVTTTVSVPDGGTVLLGGIKRLSEDRREFGVPMLNKIPYVSRLFKNVGIGRSTSSLMMMVTPRIIIQEEEEERLGIQAP